MPQNKAFEASPKDTASEMTEEMCLVVNETDVVLGSQSKLVCHYKEGIRHRAFSVLLFDLNGRLLVQRRSRKKVTFPQVWANTCCGHPLDIVSENTNSAVSGVIAAACRKLNQELGITPKIIADWEFHHIGKIDYFCRWDMNWREREIDHVLVVQGEVDIITPNTDEISEVRWLTPYGLRRMMNSEAEWSKDIIAPWFKLIWRHFINPANGDVHVMANTNKPEILSYEDITKMLSSEVD